MPYMLAVREDHRLAKRQAVTLSDLANEPFILPEGCPGLQDVSNLCAFPPHSDTGVARLTGMTLALALVVAGVGLAFVPVNQQFQTVKQVPVTDLGVFLREVELIGSGNKVSCWNSSILLQPIAGVRKTYREFETMKKPNANIPMRKANSCPWCGDPKSSCLP